MGNGHSLCTDEDLRALGECAIRLAEIQQQNLAEGARTERWQTNLDQLQSRLTNPNLPCLRAVLRYMGELLHGHPEPSPWWRQQPPIRFNVYASVNWEKSGALQKFLSYKTPETDDSLTWKGTYMEMMGNDASWKYDGYFVPLRLCEAIYQFFRARDLPTRWACGPNGALELPIRLSLHDWIVGILDLRETSHQIAFCFVVLHSDDETYPWRRFFRIKACFVIPGHEPSPEVLGRMTEWHRSIASYQGALREAVAFNEKFQYIWGLKEDELFIRDRDNTKRHGFAYERLL